MFQGRPEPGAQTGTYDTTDTAGPTARYGRVQDTAPVFATARAADLEGDDDDRATAEEAHPGG
jgi:hypothetical protein